MKNMNLHMGDSLPCGMTPRALSGKPAPDRPKISREKLSGLAQRLVARADNLSKKEKGGKLSPEGEKVVREMGELLSDHGTELDGLGVVRGGKQEEAYQAILMSRAELLSYQDGGTTGGC
jgi:hypothetical protein